MVEELSRLIDQLTSRFNRRGLRLNSRPQDEDKKYVMAACQAWFSSFRGLLQTLGITEDGLAAIDGPMKDLVLLANRSSRVGSYRTKIYLVRSAWEAVMVPAQVAEWQNSERLGQRGNGELVSAFANCGDTSLVMRYQQVIDDLSGPVRQSYTGQAAEMREILRIVLHEKGPDESVSKASWYRGAGNPLRPTQAERIRFIMEARRAQKQELETAQKQEVVIDELLGKVGRSAYERANAGVHGVRDKEELVRCLRYIEALLLDILT